MQSREVVGAAFKEAYASLNAAQKQAVNTIDGPVMVIAGPGTGKTQILALRIANILLKSDTKPANILALTFTDAGAHNMRERLRHYIGDQSYKVAVHTFHSLAGELIRQYPDSYPNIIGGRAATDIERFSLLEDIINNGDFKELRPNGDPLYYVRKLPGAIAELKKEYVTPDILSERIADLESHLEAIPKFHEKGAHKGKVRSEYVKAEKRILKLKELLLAYKQYQKMLQANRLFDFEDMIVETVRALQSNEDMLLDLQETYQYILADEHQDVNESQNKILELLANFHDQPNIFVVGDEKQSIYRFQGASLDNFLYFEDRFPGTTVITLTDNYRSTQSILDIAHTHIKSDDSDLSKLRVPLKAVNPGLTQANLKAGRQELRHFSHTSVEDTWLVDEVKSLLEKGIAPEKIAVITRYNRDVEHYAALLRQNKINVTASAESDIIEHPLTKAVEYMLTATLELANEEALFETVICSCWEINSGDLALILNRRSYSQPLRKIISDIEFLQETKVADPSRILMVAKTLERAREMCAVAAPHHILQFLLQESGLLDYVMKTDPTEGTRVLRRIYDDIEAMVVENQATTLSAVITQLRYRRTHDLPLIAPYIDADTTAVKVMTAHKSKGQEFDTVFLPSATDNAFGKATKRDYFKLPLSLHHPSAETDEEDDKRLFYVAMTRAKENLFISSAENTVSGKICEPSRFLEELPIDLLDYIDTKNLEDIFHPENILMLPVRPLTITPAIIKEIFLSRGLSVTHLNNYLEDPLKYYLENLLRRPQPQNLSLMKGNAVHEVLDKCVNRFTKNATWPNFADISVMLENALEKMPIGVNDFTRLHQQSLEAVSFYFSHLQEQTSTHSRTELALRVLLPGISKTLPEIPLTGKIDRVDYDSAGNVIRVVDYKTGKPKSRNEVEGKTKSSNGNYKRQLVFYALLLELYGANTKEVQFCLSFVEPKTTAEEVVEHSFTIEQKEIDELKEEVARVSEEIISGEKF